MTKILLVSTNYSPEPTGIAVYTTDLAETLKNAGHSIQVLTSLPHYPWWRTPHEFSYISEGRIHLDNIEIIRAQHFIPKRLSALVRMRFEFSLWWNLNRVLNSSIDIDIDLVIAVIPTVAAGLVARKFATKLRVPFGLIVQDLSGAGAKQSGLKGGFLFSKIAKYVENSVILRANSLVGVSPAISKVLKSVVGNENRVRTISNYSARQISNTDKKASRKYMGFNENSFLVLHTGNMGAKQGLENVIHAAKVLTNEEYIEIVLIGHGNQEVSLKVLAEGMNNFRVLPAVSDEDYSKLLSSADLLLVNERETQTDMSLPSKLTSYLFSNRPVIAAVPKNGATWNFLNGIAELVEAGNPRALAEKIVELSKNPNRLKELSDLGYKYAKENLDAEKGRQKYLDWVNELLKLKSS